MFKGMYIKKISDDEYLHSVEILKKTSPGFRGQQIASEITNSPHPSDNLINKMILTTLYGD